MMNANMLALLPGGPEMLLIMGALLLLFGAKKIPELMKGLGQGIKEFKHASKEIQEDDEEPAKPARKAAAKAESDDEN